MRVRRTPRPRLPRRPRGPSLRRGIYLLPSLFTVGNMFAGFASLLNSLHERVGIAAWLIVLAGILDGLDGRIARLTRSTSEFGREYDSLADVVSFGVAPAVLVYQWGLRGMGRWGWAVSFLFLVAGSVRLARFNVRAGSEDSHYFTGLPIPGGAGAMALMVLLQPDMVASPPISAAVWGFVLIVALLMVSTVPYRSYKDFKLRERWPATAFFVIAMVIAFVAVAAQWAMALFLGFYLLSGPAETVLRWIRHRPSPNAKPAPAAPASGEAPAP